MVDDLLMTTDQKMQKTVEVLKADLSKVRTGRAHTGLLESITVDYYGSEMPVSQVANLSLLDARTIGVQPWEKSMLPIVEKAIRQADLGLNPMSVGDTIRVAMPILTEETRRNLVKHVRTMVEESRVAIRNLRRDANAMLKEATKKKEISEDIEYRSCDDIQKKTDRYIAVLEKILEQKEEELLSL